MMNLPELMSYTGMFSGIFSNFELLVIAAPSVILTSAGGSITNLGNKDLTYSKSNFEQCGVIIASKDSANHESLCLQLKEIILRYEIYPGKIN